MRAYDQLFFLFSHLITLVTVATADLIKNIPTLKKRIDNVRNPLERGCRIQRSNYFVNFYWAFIPYSSESQIIYKLRLNSGLRVFFTKVSTWFLIYFKHTYISYYILCIIYERKIFFFCSGNKYVKNKFILLVVHYYI